MQPVVAGKAMITIFVFSTAAVLGAIGFGLLSAFVSLRGVGEEQARAEAANESFLD